MLDYSIKPTFDGNFLRKPSPSVVDYIEKSELVKEREVLKPFKYPFAHTNWLLSEQSHWLHSELPFHEDIADWDNKLSAHEKYFVTQIFRLFTQMDIDIAGGYVNYYLPFFKQPEVRSMLSSFAARESIHIFAYSHLIETLGMPETTYSEFLAYKEMLDKHIVLTNIDNFKNPASVVKNICKLSIFGEGVQLFSSFVMLLNFPRHSKLKSMGQIISWSQADESLHCEGLTALCRAYIEENYHVWTDDLKEEIYRLAADMVEMEDKFIDLAFEMGPMENLSAADVKKYIRYICDRRLIGLGMKGLFKIKKNPLIWVEELVNAPTHGSFFETKVTDYAKGALTGSWADVWAS